MEHYEIDILHRYRYVHLVLYIFNIYLYTIYIYNVLEDRRISIWFGLQRNYNVKIIVIKEVCKRTPDQIRIMSFVSSWKITGSHKGFFLC